MRLKLTVFILLVSASVKADAFIDSLFLKGNANYQEEQYAEAIASYTQILDSNYVSSELYFNLGNSYYQFGKIPSSILYYEKALLIDKQNKACLNNLELAKNRIDKIEPIPKLFYVNWWNYFCSLLAFNGWSILMVLSVWLLCFLIILFIKNRKKWIFNSIITSLTFCLIFIFAMLSSNEKEKEKPAIVMTNSELYSSPALKTKIGLVKAGNKALIKEVVANSKNKEVAFIYLEDGQTAYISTSELSFIK